MSQSQHSDFPSSLYDGDIGNLSYLTPSNQPATPSGSQATFYDFQDDFLRPNNPHLVPPSFTRVGPDRRKAFVLYDVMEHTEWVDWWLQTDYGGKSKIHWDTARQATIWSSFHQVAQITDGAPKVMCKRCEKILEHPHSIGPGQRGYQGTSTMAKHLKSASCQRSTGRKNAEITSFLKNGVCSEL
jgi:hypothetical protein